MPVQSAFSVCATLQVTHLSVRLFSLQRLKTILDVNEKIYGQVETGGNRFIGNYGEEQHLKRQFMYKYNIFKNLLVCEVVEGK